MKNKGQTDPFRTFKEFFGNQKWISSVEKQFEQQFKNVTGSFDKNFKKAISNLNLITSKDLAKLEKRIGDIEKRLEKIDKTKKTTTKKSSAKSTATVKTAKTKPAPKAKTAKT